MRANRTRLRWFKGDTNRIFSEEVMGGTNVLLATIVTEPDGYLLKLTKVDSDESVGTYVDTSLMRLKKTAKDKLIELGVPFNDEVRNVDTGDSTVRPEMQGLTA